MVHERFALACLFLACAFQAPAEDETDPLSRSREHYENRANAIRTKAAETRKAQLSSYRRSLQRLGANYQAKGELEHLLTVQDEIKRFEAKGDLPSKTRSKAPTLLRKLVQDSRSALAKNENARAQAIIDLTHAYIAQLESAKRRLTKEGDITKAMAMREEITRVNQDPIYTAAQFEKAAGDVDTGKKSIKPVPSPAIEHETRGHTSWQWSWSASKKAKRHTSSLKVDGKAKATDKGLHFKGGRIVADCSPHEIEENIKASGEVTIEAVFSTDALKQGGPARIVSCSLDGYNRNFTLCQEKNQLIIRLRTTRTGLNGTNPEVTLGSISKGERHHVIVSYRENELICSMDGKEKKIQQISGDLSNWGDFPLVLGNENKASRPWYGTITRVSISNAFTPANEAAKTTTHRDWRRRKR